MAESLLGRSIIVLSWLSSISQNSPRLVMTQEW